MSGIMGTVRISLFFVPVLGSPLTMISPLLKSQSPPSDMFCLTNPHPSIRKKLQKFCGWFGKAAS